MKLKIKKTKQLNGIVKIPGSKSEAIRAIFVAILAKGISQIHNVPNSLDLSDTIFVAQQFGAEIIKISCHGNCMEINSKGAPFKVKKINTGNSGITTNFATAISILNTTNVKIQSGKQMNQRSIKPLIEALEKIKNGEKEIKIASSNSQFLSALLLLCPYLKKDHKIIALNLKERPYIKMTLSFLNEQNIKYKRSKDDFIIFGNQKYQPINKIISGDYSSAAYFFAAQKLFKGNIQIKGLNKQSIQADKKIIELLNKMPQKKATLKIDVSDFPDLFPMLAVLSVILNKKTELINAKHVRFKESDRIHSIYLELKKMGAKIIENEDGLVIFKSKLKGANLDGHNDHRILMSLILAALFAKGESTFNDLQGIKKTFPEFINIIKFLGANIEGQNTILIGFKSVGKTTIALELSKKLNQHFVDLDQEIEKMTKLSPSEMIIKFGEKYFRKIEHEALKQILEKNYDSIISLGGGAAVNPKNQKLLKNQFVIHIKGSKQKILKRIKSQVLDFNALYDSRTKIYNRICDFSVTNNKIEKTIQKIINVQNK